MVPQKKHLKTLKNPTQTTSVILVLNKIITFFSHIARLSDKMAKGGKQDDLTQRQASGTLPWKKTGKNITQVSWLSED